MVLAFGVSVVQAYGVDFDEDFAVLWLRHGCFRETELVEAILIGLPLLDLRHFDEIEEGRGCRRRMDGRRDGREVKRATLSRVSSSKHNTCLVTNGIAAGELLWPSLGQREEKNLHCVVAISP